MYSNEKMADGLNEALLFNLIGYRDKLRSVLINVCGARARIELRLVRQVKGCVKKIPIFRCERLQLIVDNRIVKATWQHIIF